MKILFLTFYYYPDLCAGSFRAQNLIKTMARQLPDGEHIDVITTQPNRYSSYKEIAPELEVQPGLTIHRVRVSSHKSGMLDQIRAFSIYASEVIRLVRSSDYQLVCATSSRLMTAALSAYVARNKSAPLYLDIRDIFVETITDVLPKYTAIFIKPLFSLIESWTVYRASKVNLISEGFKEYFQSRYTRQDYTFYTNCIDPEFIGEKLGDFEENIHNNSSPLTVLYAGNIGEGQGLHKVLPGLAKRLEGRIRFRLIGDGGRKTQLEQLLSESNCRNVDLLPPVGRSQLMVEYKMADILFVHLNDNDAFRKVLPSKLFEYASTGKPIWAGVSGYAEAFIKKEITNAVVFRPCDADDAVKALDVLDLSQVNRAEFLEKYSCDAIMKMMVRDIIACRQKKFDDNTFAKGKCS